MSYLWLVEVCFLLGTNSSTKACEVFRTFALLACSYEAKVQVVVDEVFYCVRVVQ